MDNKTKNEEVKTDVLPGMSEKVNTSVLPGMSEKVNTSVLPGMSEKVNTSVLPEMSEKVNTSTLPNVEENGKNDFINDAAQKNTRKFYGNNGNNNNNTEKVIVNENGDKHYRIIGECFNEGGEAELYHVECIETKKRYVAKIYFNKKYNCLYFTYGIK